MKSKTPKKRLPKILRPEPTIADMLESHRKEAEERFYDSAREVWQIWRARKDILLTYQNVKVDNTPLARAFLEFDAAGEYLHAVS